MGYSKTDLGTIVDQNGAGDLTTAFKRGTVKVLQGSITLQLKILVDALAGSNMTAGVAKIQVSDTDPTGLVDAEWYDVCSELQSSPNLQVEQTVTLGALPSSVVDRVRCDRHNANLYCAIAVKATAAGALVATDRVRVIGTVLY